MSASQMYADFRATDLAAWPEHLRAKAWALPVMSLSLTVQGEALTCVEPVPETAPRDLMPKLTIKSWRESGSLRMIARDMPLAPAVASLLVSTTWQQRFVLEAWRAADEQPLLHLLAWRDTSRVDEARFSVGADGVRLVSSCLRCDGPRQTDAARDLAALAHAALGLDRTLIVQVAYGGDGQPYVVDINPGLSRPELALIEEMTAA